MASQQPLPPASEWRYYAQNILTGEWLSRELPLSDVKLTPTLSGPCGMSATIAPEYQHLKTPTGGLVLAEWQTLIVAEAAGQLRGGGLLTSMQVTGQELDLDITGVSGYPDGQPLRETLSWGGKNEGTSGHGVDPLDVVRALWGYLQSQPDGNLGVTLDDTSTPYRLGEWHNTRRMNTDGELDEDPKAVASTPVPIDKIWRPGDKPPVAAQGKELYWQYELPWHDNTDVGRHITNLAKQTPYDWTETYTWADETREQVVCHIHLGYPRLGRRQHNLRFVEGENIIALVPVHRDGDDYANSVTVYGAGEGSKKVRATASTRDGRLLRARSVDRPDLTTEAQCRAVADEELRRWSKLVDITGLTIIDHPNAPIGSFAVGDDVLVHTRAGWTPTRLWVRVTDMTITPGSGEIDVSCSRSDRFNYPAGRGPAWT